MRTVLYPPVHPEFLRSDLPRGDVYSMKFGGW